MSGLFAGQLSFFLLFVLKDTEKYADASAAVMSIIETAKRNNLDVYGYLLCLLTILPELGNNPKETPLEAVMPWIMTLPAYCRQMYHEICNGRDFKRKC